MAINIYKGDRPSAGATALRDALRGAGQRSLILRAEGSTFRGKQGDKIINWGTRVPRERLEGLIGAGELLNHPTLVGVASNKKECLTRLNNGGVNIVPFFENLQNALSYIEGGHGRIYARTVLNGHSGEGIVLILHPDDPQLRNQPRGQIPYPVVLTTEIDLVNGVPPHNLQNCQLFTAGHVGKRVEYRVHVVRGEAVLVQRKLRRYQEDAMAAAPAQYTAGTSLVRNLASGWVYSVNFDKADDVYLGRVQRAGIDAIGVLGLDFGAVDILVDTDQGVARVLEVNTAPGLEGETTLQAYVDAFAVL